MCRETSETDISRHRRELIGTPWADDPSRHRSSSSPRTSPPSVTILSPLSAPERRTRDQVATRLAEIIDERVHQVSTSAENRDHPHRDHPRVPRVDKAEVPDLSPILTLAGSTQVLTDLGPRSRAGLRENEKSLVRSGRGSSLLMMPTQPQRSRLPGPTRFRPLGADVDDPPGSVVQQEPTGPGRPCPR